MIGAGAALAAEHKFDLSEMPVGEAPKGFTSTVVGEGKPGQWKVMLDEVPMARVEGRSEKAKMEKKSILAQVSVADMAENHVAMLILGPEAYGDFTFRAQLKIEKSIFEQSAGIAFRFQDEKNFYAVRADANEHSLKFYKVQNGKSKIFGPPVPIDTGFWYELTVECKGQKIRCLLDGEAWPMGWMEDDAFAAGKIGIWTKSDTAARFADMSVTYTQREPFAQMMVRDTMKQYPRLLGVKVFMAPPPEAKLQMVASNDEKEIGQSGEKTDADVIDRGVNYFRREKEVVSVTMPLRDRNGDIVAAVRVMMKSFPGQTEENAVVRAMPIVKEMQQRASSVNSLME